MSPLIPLEDVLYCTVVLSRPQKPLLISHLIVYLQGAETTRLNNHVQIRMDVYGNRKDDFRSANTNCSLGLVRCKYL